MNFWSVTITSIVAWLGSVCCHDGSLTAPDEHACVAGQCGASNLGDNAHCGTNCPPREALNVDNVSAELPPSDTLIRLLRFHNLPVTLSLANPVDSKADIHIDVQNVAAQEIVGIRFVLAGEHCKAKPAWPVLTYGHVDGSVADSARQLREPPIAPGAGAPIEIRRPMLVDVTSVSERTCGRRSPPELAVTHVQFRDGSNWDLGEEMRKAP
jgi:hypothetical protein